MISRYFSTLIGLRHLYSQRPFFQAVDSQLYIDHYRCIVFFEADGSLRFGCIRNIHNVWQCLEKVCQLFVSMLLHIEWLVKESLVANTELRQSYVATWLRLQKDNQLIVKIVGALLRPSSLTDINLSWDWAVDMDGGILGHVGFG